ncbi:MAG: ester cyclase [Acetobacteraceae bacterium]|nr:ester cyclase [Acetobacteraceae bacterium]
MTRLPDDAPSSSQRGQVLQVERRDFVDLAPTDRPRVQSMRGFDPIYTDIVDYIVRCTHRIWDERDIGLIYSHYTHNAVVYYTLNTVYDREAIVHDTIARLATFPERRGMATQVIWTGNDVDGFYTSHLVTGSGRHTQPGPYGPPTGRSFNTRTVADCMVFENRIYREWIATDGLGLVRQLGLDADELAEARAREMLSRGQEGVDIGEVGRMLGQMPPDREPDLGIAHTETEAWALRGLHEIYNRRMLGQIRTLYAANAQWHGPLMKELNGRAAITHQALALLGTLPDCAWVPQHVCSVASEQGGEKIAIRWVLEGHHLGYGLLGKPTGHRVFALGFTHLHVQDGRIMEEWTVYDLLAMLTQVKLGALASG